MSFIIVQPSLEQCCIGIEGDIIALYWAYIYLHLHMCINLYKSRGLMDSTLLGPQCSSDGTTDETPPCHRTGHTLMDLIYRLSKSKV